MSLLASASLVLIFFGGWLGHPAAAENRTVTIPEGAANPNFDTPTTEWFSPSVVTVHAGDTITWVNKDKEIHNITSGKGISRLQFVTTSNVGTPDGLFSSGPFKPGESWSHTFTKPGIYHYFCSIHPWMNGAVVVNEQIPTVPTDATGQPIAKWPVEQTTLDGLYEVDLAWEPHVILTGEKITLVYQIYNGVTGRIIESGVPYTLIIIQNGNVLFRTNGGTQIGGDYKFFAFSDPGMATFRFQNIGGGNSFSDFSTLVYQNPNGTNTQVPIIQPARNIVFGQELAIALVAPAVGAMLITFLSAKGLLRLGRKKKADRAGGAERRSPV